MPKPDVSEQRIPEILDAAAQVFSEHGIDGASMAQIAKAAGVSKAMIYYYFDGKEALVTALVENLFDADQAGLEALIASDTPALQRLDRYVVDLVDLLESNAVLYPVFAAFKARSARVGEVQRTMGRYFTRYVDAFASIIQQGIDAGQIRAVEPRVAALTLTAVVEGSILMRHTLGRPLPEVLPPSVSLFLQGLAR